MEKQIDSLKIKVERLENITRGMVSDLDTLMSKSSSVKNIDIHEETKEKKDGKKANNKTSSNSGKSSNRKDGDSKGQNNTNGDGSK